MKKLEEEEDGDDSFWSSAPPESIRDDDDHDEILDHKDIELSGGTKSWLSNGVLVRQWTEDGRRRVLEWECDGWRGECPDCLQRIVHVCPDDAIFLQLSSEY